MSGTRFILGSVEDRITSYNVCYTKLLRGVFDYDAAGNFVTPLVEGRECAFVYFEGETALCAIEKAWMEGKITFRKPLSCHLYPVRIQKLKENDGINYHKWHICKPALKRGRNEGIPLYQFLKEPLIRAYGERNNFV